LPTSFGRSREPSGTGRQVPLGSRDLRPRRTLPQVIVKTHKRRIARSERGKLTPGS
jgi:hypothetical protein